MNAWHQGKSPGGAEEWKKEGKERARKKERKKGGREFFHLLSFLHFCHNFFLSCPFLMCPCHRTHTDVIVSPSSGRLSPHISITRFRSQLRDIKIKYSERVIQITRFAIFRLFVRERHVSSWVFISSLLLVVVMAVVVFLFCFFF